MLNTIYILLFFYINTLNLYFNGQEENDYYLYNWQVFYTIPQLQYEIDLHNPDYKLLDAALFHATNEIREKHNRVPLKYSPILHHAARIHSKEMIINDFHDHFNNRNKIYYNPDDRIKAAGGRFSLFAENIAQFQLIKTGHHYCPQKLKNGSYTYMNCDNDQPYPTFTYLQYARRVVDGWLNSPPHRKNLLSKDVQFGGCAVEFSKNPYQQKTAPFGRITQNLGGGKLVIFSASESI